MVGSGSNGSGRAGKGSGAGDLTWHEHYRLWSEARERNEARLRMQAARKRVAQNSAEDWAWLRASLSDEERRWFVAAVFRFQQVPRRLLAPMLRAGVLERDPSANRVYVEPCVRSFGTVRVATALLSYLETGSNEEIAGAASALYWGWQPRPDEEVTELRARIQAAKLRTFVDNDDLDVRRRILPGLRLKSETYPEELRPLVARAVEIARAHPDEYIRHRVEVQLGAGGPYMAIPAPKPE